MLILRYIDLDLIHAKRFEFTEPYADLISAELRPNDWLRVHATLDLDFDSEMDQSFKTVILVLKTGEKLPHAANHLQSLGEFHIFWYQDFGGFIV